VLRLLIGLSAVILVCGCDLRSPAVRVAAGNYAYERGNYQQALVHYLVGAESSDRESWFSYNIGNVYHALGESEAALEMWALAARSPDQSIQFGTSFNRGVLLYEMGRYQDAYEAFRHALTVNSASTDAKINLELSLQKIQAEDSATSSESAQRGGEPEDGVNQETMRIIEYVRRKEEQQWTANRQPTPTPHNRDW